MKALSLAKQVEKIANDRTYLRGILKSVISMSKGMPDAVNAEVVKIFQQAIDRTADENET